MRRFVAMTLVIAFVFGFAAIVFASQETVEVRMSKLIDQYAMKTQWGNVYFTIRDIHKITHGAAKLRPVKLGTFNTDGGQQVRVSTQSYNAGMVTILIQYP